MMRIEYCADSGIGVAPHSSLAQEILDELEATDEQPEEEEAESNPVEDRAKLLFDEITARFPPEWGKDPRQLMRERYRYLSRRSIQLENEAVEKAVDALKANVKTLTDTVKEIVPERDQLKLEIELNDAATEAIEAERDELKDVIGQVRSVRDELKAELEAVTKERDEACQRAKDRETARYVLTKERAELQAKVEELTVDRAHWEGSAGGWEKLYRIERALRESYEQLVQKERDERQSS
jgi:chromosome segregation ATPase